MRIGLPLEGIFVDMDAHFDFWIARMGLDVDSRFSPKILGNEGFWASAQSNEGIAQIGDLMLTLTKQDADEFFILTERPPKLMPITRSWLSRNGVHVKTENIIMSSKGGLKRYDCRQRQIEYYIDCDYEILNTFVHDYTIPVGIGNPSDFEEWIQVHDTVNKALFDLEPDRRNNFIWPT